MLSNFDTLKLAVETVHPNNTVLLDDMGMPSVMVRIPKFKISDVIDGGSSVTHPAFIVGGKEVPEICISKYPNIVMNERAYSLPMKDPRAYVTFDQARQYCQAKGKGWHLMSNAEWAAIALWCKKNGYTPQGNTNYGANHAAPHEKGVASYIYDGGKTVGRTYTGSGPVTWAHDKTAAGIYDLCGNVWEWASGLRLKNGELQVIKDNDSAMGVDEGPNSSLWRAITQDGSLVAPGTAGTLKYDNTIAGDATQTAHDIGGAVELSTTRSNPMYTGGDVDDYWTYQYQTFESLAAKSGVTVPELLKVLGLFPLEANGHDGDGLWVRNYGERLPLRGGAWGNTSWAGVFALNVNCTRVHSESDVGFRAASPLPSDTFSSRAGGQNKGAKGELSPAKQQKEEPHGSRQ